jgi:large subunit ribosomal protein L5
MPNLKDRYTKEVVPAMQQEFGLTNVMQVPHIKKIVINIGMGEALDNAKAMDAAVNDMQIITGQKVMVTRAKKDISNFKLRADKPIGVMVTLRGDRMWNFLDRLMNIALPRVRDFRGIPAKGFDGRGNYTMGLREQLVFPEIEYDKIDKVRGMEITVVTSAQTDEHGRRLLTLLGMPFQQQGNN